MKSLLIVLIVAAPVAAEVKLIFNSGVYTIDTSSAEPTLRREIAFEADDIVLSFLDESPKPPPKGDLLEQLTEISKSRLKTKNEATSMAVIVDAARLASDEHKTRKIIIDQSIAALSSQMPDSAGNFAAWLKDVEALGLYTDDFLNTVLNALKDAWDVEPAAMAKVAEVVASSDTERLDLIGIIELIMKIIELLRDLGIIGGE